MTNTALNNPLSLNTLVLRWVQSILRIVMKMDSCMLHTVEKIHSDHIHESCHPKLLHKHLC